MSFDTINLPIDCEFVPLTAETMNRVDGVLEGTLKQVVALAQTWGGIVLEPEGDQLSRIFYTHPMFNMGVNSAYGHNKVRVSLESDKLYLRFLNLGTNNAPMNSPTTVSEPVKLSNASLAVALKLMELTSHYQTAKCAMRCGATHTNWPESHFRSIELPQAALVMTPERDIVVLCQDCCGPRLPTGWTVLLKGWELPPRAPVTIWNIPKISIIKQ